MPKISFVVPSRNRIEWLGECLIGLLAQTEPDIEVVVVNDASTDGTKEFLTDWASKDPRVKIIHNLDPQGAGRSRNIGMKMATADIIGVCDDDDVYIAERAEYILRWFKENPESELVNFPYIEIDYFNQPLNYMQGQPFDHEEFKKSGHISYFANPTCAYKKASAEAMGGYPAETDEMTDDYQFVKAWVEAGKKIDFCPDTYVCLHRILPDSIMAKHRGFDARWVVKK